MMTVGNVLEHKNAVLASSRRGASGMPADRLEDLHSSLEYKAWEAFNAGRLDESQGIVRQLLQLERSKAPAPGPADATLLLAVERNIRNVLVKLEKVTALNKFKVAEAVTEFLWESMEVSH